MALRLGMLALLEEYVDDPPSRLPPPIALAQLFGQPGIIFKNFSVDYIQY